MGSSIGPVIALQGEAEFKRAIKDIDTSLKTLGTEMKAVTSAYDRNDKSASKLTAQNQVLNKQIDAQRQKVSDLAAQVEKSAEAYGENSSQTQYYRQQLNNATAALNKSERALESNNKALSEYENEAKKATWQTQEFKDKTEKLGDSLKSIGGKISGFGKTMSMAVTAPIAAAGAASFKFAADLQDAMGAADQIFKSASTNVKNWADNLGSQYGIAEAEALTYANTMGAMLQNIGGLTEQEAAKQSQTLVELAGDLTAMFGGTTESAVQALTGALKGNNAMLDNYGMGVNDATIKAKALEMGIYSGAGAMELQTKQAATLALIMEQTADAQGQAAREADGASGSIRSIQTELKNLATDIGEVLLPILTPLIASLRDMVERFGELSPEAQKTIVVVAGVAAALGPLLIVIGGAISAVGTITAALPVLGAAFTALTGPLGLAVAAVAGVVAIGVALYKNWDTVKAKAKDLASSIVNTFNAIKDRMASIGKNIVTGLWSGISGSAKWLLDRVRQWCGSILSGIKAFFGIKSPSTVMAGIGKFLMQGLGNGISESKSLAINAAKEVSNLLIAEEERLQKVLSDMDAAAIKKREGESEQNHKKALEEKYAELSKAEKSGKQKILDDIAKLQSDREKTLAEESENALKEALNNQLKIVQNFKTEYENAVKEIERSQENMSSKLVDFGGLFEKTKNKLGKEVFGLTDLQGDIDMINRYGKALEDLKTRGVSDSLLAEIEGMNIDDAIDFTSELLKKTDDGYKEYMALWEEKQKAAKDVASKFYKSEMDSLKAEFADKIPDELSAIKDEMSDIGVMSGKGLADGFKSQAKYIKDTFISVLKDALSASKASMDMHSPSKKWAEVGDGMAQGLGIGFTEQMREVTRQINASVPTTVNSPTAKMGEGIVNGLSSILPQTQGGNVTIQVILPNGKELAQVVYDPILGIARQKGVAFSG